MAQITRIDGDSYNLFVPGTDPAQIIADAQAELDDDEVVLTTADEIQIRWYRVNPCHPNNCYDGGHHNGHWEPTLGKTRGGFQGAMLVTGHVTEAASR